VNLRSFLIPVALALPALAQTAPTKTGPTKIAIIQFQGAVLTTQEGQRAAAAMKSKFDPRKTALQKRQADLQAMQTKLQQGGATLSGDARTKLERDIQNGTRSLNNDAEDLNNEVQEEQNKMLQGMASKMGEIIKNYATQNGYVIVLDVSSEQTPVLWADPSSNITEAIVKLYDQKYPVTGGAAPAAGAPTASKPPANPPAARPKPPASKKQ
jgi:outer membrane protein